MSLVATHGNISSNVTINKVELCFMRELCGRYGGHIIFYAIHYGKTSKTVTHNIRICMFEVRS